MDLGSSTKFCLGITSIFFAVLALLFGVYGVFTCNAVDFEQTNGDGAIAVGLFGYRTKTYTTVQGDTDTVWVSNTCVDYERLNSDDFTYTMDKMAESLQALAIALAIIGGFFTVVSCFVPCIPYFPAKVWKGMGLLFLICCIFQGCSLLVLQSSICDDNPVIQYLQEANPVILETLNDPAKCTRAPGFNFGIAATVFWFVAGIIPLVVPAPSYDVTEEDRVSSPAVAAEPDVEATKPKPEEETPAE
mmetsp:Transcript_8868/g.14222  ORF Transcript_8868/g.14222 Transcript_8868/m.14222 type:complete len:246 (+) Transcript_8868:415-1152(+)